MKRLRTMLFWIHLTAGLLAGGVILVMSFTGVVLALKPQIQNWIERDVRYVTPQTTPRLSPYQLLTAVTLAKPEAPPQSLAFARDPAAAAVVNVGREGNIYVDPYNGALLGTGSARTNEFFQSVTSWHRYLGATGEYRATGRSATGISNAAFLVLGITGLYLWWPKQLTRQYLKSILWFRKTSTGRARDFNWHNTIGFWCLIPIVIMTASGVVMSYPWANTLVYRLTGSPVPGGRGEGPPREGPRGPQREQAGPIIPANLDRVWTRAEQQVPTWSQISLRLPTREGGPVAFTIADGENWNSFARSNLTLSSADARVLQWQPYDANNTGQKLRGWLRFAHTGELGGLPGQIVAGLGCLGGVFLVYTGVSLAVRRLWNWNFVKGLRSSRRHSPGTRTAIGADAVAAEAVVE